MLLANLATLITDNYSNPDWQKGNCTKSNRRIDGFLTIL